jgi:bifunctional oligoribonuclease and PAP phosphatase NrnA
MQSQSLILTTHRHCDGDGLGAELAVAEGLRKLGKKVEIINLDRTPKKYRFLKPDDKISYFEEWREDRQVVADLALVFDTNDKRLLPGFYEYLRTHTKKIVFIDHHPVLKNGPLPTEDSVIDTSAASTGEMAFDLLKALGVEMDREIARYLYTSLVFDTQLFRFIRNSPRTHEISAELLKYPINASEIHRGLFGNQTVQKVAFLAKALNRIEYFLDGKIALLRIQTEDMRSHQLETDESRDVIDMLMNIETLEIAILIREDSPNEFKISLRSKGTYNLLSAAEKFGGGGHIYSAGAFVKDNYENIRKTLLNDVISLFPKSEKAL